MNKGNIVVIADTNFAPTAPIYNTTTEVQYETEEQRALRLREEKIDVTKECVQVGEVQLRKEIVEEQRTVVVPVIREEVYVERRPVIDGKFDDIPMNESEIIRIPIMEEQIEVTKRPVVIEEVIVEKRRIEETRQVQDVIRKEEARIERASLPAVQENGSLVTTIDVADAQVDEMFEGSLGYPSVQKEVEMAALANEAKDATRDPQGGFPATQENKSTATSTNNKKAGTNVKHSEPAAQLNKNIAISASANDKKEGASVKRADSPAAEENKNTTASDNKKKK
jgi:uncharacterized protein (TIGR02271 family)